MNSTTTTGRSHCIGRFSFVGPETLNVAGRSQSLYRTNVATIPIPTGGVDEYWAGRLARMGGSPRTFDLQPGWKAAWSARNSVFPKILTLEVMKPVSGGLIVVDRESDAGKESIAERLVSDIINAHVSGSDHGFCVGNGAITLEPSQNEKVRMHLVETDSPEIEIQFETLTVREPDTKTYSDVDEEKSLASAHGGTLTVLRNQKRSAAGLQGNEIWISLAVPSEKPGLRFSWHYAGVGASSTQPSINIVGSAPVEKKAQLERVWDSILTSLKAVPLGTVIK